MPLRNVLNTKSLSELPKREFKQPHTTGSTNQFTRKLTFRKDIKSLFIHIKHTRFRFSHSICFSIFLVLPYDGHLVCHCSIWATYWNDYFAMKIHDLYVLVLNNFTVLALHVLTPGHINLNETNRFVYFHPKQSFTFNAVRKMRLSIL